MPQKFYENTLDPMENMLPKEEYLLFNELTWSFDNYIFKYEKYYGEITEKGEILFAIRADNLIRLNEKLLAIKLNKKWGVIDNNLNYIINPQYEELTSFDKGQEYFCVKQNGKYGLINTNNEIVFDFIYDEIDQWYGFSIAKKDNRFGFIDAYGKSTKINKTILLDCIKKDQIIMNLENLYAKSSCELNNGYIQLNLFH